MAKGRRREKELTPPSPPFCSIQSSTDRMGPAHTGEGGSLHPVC